MESITVRDVGIGYSANVAAVEAALLVLFSRKGEGTIALRALAEHVWGHIAGKNQTITKAQVRRVKDELIETLNSICQD